jgi:hypothetical protein
MPPFHIELWLENQPLYKCEGGETGRRTRFRFWRGNPWGFNSPPSHQYEQPKCWNEAGIIQSDMKMPQKAFKAYEKCQRIWTKETL